MSNIRILIDLIRVRQWYKNVIIFLPLVFSFGFFSADKFSLILAGFFALSLVSSAMYVRNDIKDVEQDRSHPLKTLRAFPSGKISTKLAWSIFLILLSSGFTIAYVLDFWFFIIVILLFVNTEIYTRYTKKIIFLDVFSIGINFIIRAISGIVLLNTPLSPWIILGVFFVALFLAFIKRKVEMMTLKGDAHKHRESLKDYSEFSLNTSLGISAVMVIITYSLYAMNGPTNDWRLIITVPFIIFVILRQIHLSSINDKTAQTNEIIKDKQSLIAILSYVILTIVLLYLGPSEIFSHNF